MRGEGREDALREAWPMFLKEMGPVETIRPSKQYQSGA